MRHNGPWIAVALLLLLATPHLAAQDRNKDLTISLTGITRADLEVVDEAGSRERLAQLTSALPTTIARSGLLGKSQRTTVQVQRSLDNVVVLLQPGGVKDNECNRIPPGSLDECQTIGVFVNRPGAELSISSLGGVINLVTNSPWRRARVGVEGAYTRFTRLESVACSDEVAGLTDCTVEDARIGTGIYAEYNLLPSWALSARLGIGRYVVDQVYGQSTASHDVSVKSLDLGLQYRFGTGPFTPFINFGPSMYFNSSDVIRNGIALEGNSESGIRIGAGAGFDFGLGNRVFGRAQGSYWSGGSDDADTNFRLGIGAGFNF